MIVDPSSFANIQAIQARHLHLSLTADFDKKVLHGHVIHTLQVVQDGVAVLVLDSNQVDITSASLLEQDGKATPLGVKRLIASCIID